MESGRTGYSNPSFLDLLYFTLAFSLRGNLKMGFERWGIPDILLCKWHYGDTEGIRLDIRDTVFSHQLVKDSSRRIHELVV